MSTRIFLTALLGAIAMFIWNFVAHMLLPLATVGIHAIPKEQAVLDALQANIGAEPGIYLFPAGGGGPDATKQEQEAAMKKMPELYAHGPSGFLIYHPPGRAFAFGKWLGVEFLAELIEAILVVSLLAQTRIVSFGGIVAFVFVAGILAAIATNISYWNWYGFPTGYTLGYMTTQVVGFLCVGVVAGLMLKNRAA